MLDWAENVPGRNTLAYFDGAFGKMKKSFKI
jgi:hypothetical protein